MNCRNEACYTTAREEMTKAVAHLRKARNAINQTVSPPESLKAFYLGAVLTQIEMLGEIINRAERDEQDGHQDKD